MASNENDTDPSTPSARRSTEARPDALNDTDPEPVVGSRPPRPTTNPGLGSPGTSRPVSGRPMGIVVPAVGPDLRKDSVELLLDGITGPQPERTKTTPQTDGEASAAYHARHALRPAHTSPDDEPKVVVERTPQMPTMRIERPLSPEALRAAHAPTAIPPPSLLPRIALAMVSGLLVVLGVFAVFRLVWPVSETAGPPRGTPPAMPAWTARVTGPASALSSASSVGVAVAPAVDMPRAAATAAALATATATSVATAMPTAVRAANAPAARPKPRAPAHQASDMDELRTTLH